MMSLQCWPTLVEEVSPLIREFIDSQGHLSISNGLLTSDDCTLIPADMREEILEGIHTGHQGITKSRECANLSMVARNFQGDQGKNRVMPLLSGTSAISREGANNHPSSTRQAMTEGFHKPIQAI